MRDFIFGIAGGTALLMYGVDKMGDGLEKASGRFMKRILTVLTGNIWSAFFVGIIMTALVQSSTAITVLTVGFVNAGLMNLSQAVGIIYGANIGTTITAQLMAFSFTFKLTEIALPIIALGFIIGYFSKKDTIKNMGNALMGFGMMFLGLKLLNGGVPYIRESESLKFFFTNYASVTIIGILLGALATALVHSSSATVGLVLILGQAGVLDLSSAICIMLGDNIGTCITAQLASLTGNINARRTAWAHTLYNLIGVIIVAIIKTPFIKAVEASTWYFNGSNDISLQIANSHTIFNVLSAAVFLPLNKYYVKFLQIIIKDNSTDKYKPLNHLLINTPIAAFKAVLGEIEKSLNITKNMISKSLEAFYTNEAAKLEEVKANEEVLNTIQKDITSYIVELSKQPLTENYSCLIPSFINIINNVERAGDHTVEYMGYITTKIDKQLPFSEASLGELKKLEGTVLSMIELAIESINEKDINKFDKISELEAGVDEQYEHALNNHLKRLETGKCNIEAGMIFVDLVNHLERIADHIYKVGRIASLENVISSFK